MRALTIASLVVALALIGAGCGSKSKSKDEARTTTATETTTPTATTPAAPKQTTGSNPALKKKPRIAKLSGPPPKRLVVKDLITGSGPTATAGNNVTVQYVGVSYRTGKQFDASWDRGQPFPFQLGAGRVIPGWDKGVVGMKVGGRRQLIIPPALAYGPQGQPPSIAPNETLVFDIDLLSVQ